MKLPPIENMTGVFDVRGMNVVVTGGNRGIGYGISKAFAQSGCNVAKLQVIIEKQRPITRSMGNKRRNRRDGAFPSTTASAHHRHQKALPLRVGQFAIDARKQRFAAGRQDRKAPLVGFDMWLPHSYVCCA